jgi:putative membrane protein
MAHHGNTTNRKAGDSAMMWGWNNGGWQGAGAGWMVGMMVFWIAIIGIGIWLVVRLTDRKVDQHPKIESPRALLDRRFASGDLNVDQYAEARRLLESQALPRQ